MCLAPQWRAIFRHPHFKKWPEDLMFLTFWLANVLLATAACKFSTDQRPKMLRSWGVLCIFTCKCASRHSGVPFFDIATSKSPPTLRCFVHLTWKCASRHSGVPFFLSALSSYLRTRRFSEPNYFSTQPTHKSNPRKNTAFRDFPNISRVWIFFLLTFAQLYLLSSDSTSLLCFSSSDSTSLLCFSSSDSASLLCFFRLSILSEVRLLNFLW